MGLRLIFLLAQSPVIGFFTSKEGEVILIICLITLYIFIFIFWLVMLLDAVRNRSSQGTVWIIIIALAGFIGSVLYYFMVVRKRKEKTPAEPVQSDSNAYYLGGASKDDIIKY